MKIRFMLIYMVTYTFFFSLTWADDDILILTLDRALLLAEQNSPELKYLNLQIMGQKHAYTLGFREFLPRLSAGYSQSDTIKYGEEDTRLKTVSLTISQLLFNGGRNIIQRKLLKLNLSLESYSLQQKREEIRDKTWKLFYQILMVKEKLILQDEIYQIALKQLAISRKEWELGEITEIDLIETELEVKNLEIQIKQTQIEVEALYYQFRMLLGLSPDIEFRLAGEINKDYEGLIFNENAYFWLSLAMASNIELQKMEFDIEKTRQEVKIAERNYLPRVDADFSLLITGTEFPLKDIGFSVKLKISFPFKPAPLQSQLSGGKTGARQRDTALAFSADILPDLGFILDKKLALIQMQIMQLQEDQAIESLRFSIDQFLKNHTQEVEKIILRKETLVLLRRKLIVSEQKLDIGEIKRIDYLKAQTEYLEEEITALENILALIEMERSFEKMIGLDLGELKKYTKAKEQKESDYFEAP